MIGRMIAPPAQMMLPCRPKFFPPLKHATDGISSATPVLLHGPAWPGSKQRLSSRGRSFLRASANHVVDFAAIPRPLSRSNNTRTARRRATGPTCGLLQAKSLLGGGKDLASASLSYTENMF